ncbi:ABC transporter ATP-binding protein [Rhizobium sp. KVB221]|uniref:ABC transporter ATP-binding protein n=1 Tax=Rhizobium setariae TaxID=2801340 RepID=A0A936YR71_9HYPH|nr:ABC transporter ATP-binding protein [Rhizobium setariae]MBL0375223.1 ABC transporter ATP-binding protein [Rhizobium setariae]
MSTLELVNVTKAYGNTVAVDGIDLKIENNEFFCIFGPPSSGKSTILRLFLGLAHADSGRVLIGGRDVTDVPPADRDLAMVFQNLALFPHLTARQNMEFPLRERRETQAIIDARVKSVAEKLHITLLLEKFPAQLSGGERQRVAIGRALVRKPSAYLMDEPIAALDARLREEMRVELKRLQREVGHTLVYVTHDQEEAMSIADRMAIVENGRIAQIGSPDEIYNNPASRYVAELVGSPPMNFIEGSIVSGRFRASKLDLEVNLDNGLSDRDIVLGIRPEDLSLHEGGGAQGHGSNFKVYETEPLGAYSIVDIIAGDIILKAQMRGLAGLSLGQEVALRIEPGHCHAFDPINGANLLHNVMA